MRKSGASKKSPKAIDLFAGCGGLTAGLRAAGFTVVAAVENDPDAAASFAANHRGVLLYESDIRDVDPATVLSDLGLKPGELDLIAGCPPCQGFTRMTEYNGKRERRNSLVREYFKFVEVIMPKVCMLENVPGLFNTKKGRRYFNELRRGLERLKYKLSYDILELADYGVPQFRKRLVLLASKREAIEIPAPTHAGPMDERPRAPRWRTVRAAIGDLGRPPLRSRVVSGKVKPKYEWHYTRNVAPIVKKRLQHALKKGSRSTLPPHLRLQCHKDSDGHFDVYGVMRWDAPSPTITSGCTNASKGRFGHPSQARPLTPREAARLQTFPLRYKFEGGGAESVAAQIGNALPRHFARLIGRTILGHLTRNAASALKRKPIRLGKVERAGGHVRR